MQSKVIAACLLAFWFLPGLLHFRVDGPVAATPPVQESIASAPFDLADAIGLPEPKANVPAFGNLPHANAYRPGSAHSARLASTQRSQTARNGLKLYKRTGAYLI